MPFPQGLFPVPTFEDVLGFSGGQRSPFQQAHVLGDKKVVPQLENLFDFLGRDALPQTDPSS